METLLLAVAAVIAVYIAVMVILPKITGDTGAHTRKALDKIYKQNVESSTKKTGESVSIVKDEMGYSSPIARMFFAIPGIQYYYDLILKAGLSHRIQFCVLGMLLVFAVIAAGFARIGMGALGLIISLAIALYALRFYLRYRIEKRNDTFISMFPDALDMIVRSVRSGFPLNTALRMIAENSEPPVSTEFRQVVDEIAYGRTMTDALQRLAQRVDVPDIQFFVVVLTVQQEAGGNLAEVMSNLSNVIRKRKQLNLKIKALTSEGRATGWVLGSLPVFMFCILMWLAPNHLQPLFDTTPGNIVLASAIGMVALAAWIVNQMIKIDI